ncbi:hypothetical protein [Rhizomonospora bruguierae]|uniref:hypothetical protein n=1 Tax=Rhizomonospora bruguierae TaxID=1581705 RepID=UPI001BD080F5|nr:hypothetical protein [Micromonospora sp. NBRC 107566]
MGWRTGRTVLRGVVLGGALLAALTVVGALARAPRGPAGPALAPPSPSRSGPLTAIQPELREALLTGADLPGYEPQPQPRHTGSGPGQRVWERDVAGCAALVERPWEVTGEPVGERTEIGDGRGLLTQTVTLLTGPDREAPVGRVVRTARECREFAAELADGVPVPVRANPVAVDDTAGSGTGYALRFAGGGRYGYVVVFRLGPMLSVLRGLGTRPVTDAEVVRTLRLATARLGDATPPRGTRSERAHLVGPAAR